MGLQFDLSMSCQLPPIRTTAMMWPDDDEGCATPTSADSVIPAPSVCPPAPRKPIRPPPPATPMRKKNKKKKRGCYSYGRRCRCCGSGHAARWFVAVPHDLATVFVARRPATAVQQGSVPCRQPAGKKICLHVVG